MKKTIRDFNLENKKVIIRVDFNVPMKDGIISDDTRIIGALPTIRYALEKNAKVILMSHLGRIKTEEDKKNNTLRPVSLKLSELLGKEVIFVPETRGKLLEEVVSKLNPGEIILMENTRYEDLNGKLESSNDEALGKYWASLGDIFINDAFGTSHRAHASNVGIASYIPSGIGFLIEKELLSFDKVLYHPDRPFTVILGGAKVSDKIGVIENLIEKVDYIIIGGAMAYTFLKAENLPIGHSIFDTENYEFAKKMLNQYKDKIILPVDHIVKDKDEKIMSKRVEDTAEEDIGFDIGNETIQKFKDILKISKTVLWNGPVGMFEDENFAKGTFELMKFLEKEGDTVILGGGDTASAASKFHMSFTHISTGGGASLELLEGKILPGVDCINEKI